MDGHFTGVYDGHGRPPLTAPQPMLTVDDLDPPAMALAVANENGTDLTWPRPGAATAGSRSAARDPGAAGRS